MRRHLAGLLAACAAAAALLVTASPASATTTTVRNATSTVYYETVPAADVIFVPACTPGPTNPACDPRGPGSVLISRGDLSLTQGGPSVGTVRTVCVTTFKSGNDYYGWCVVTLTVDGRVITATGVINESALERFEPQRLKVRDGTLTIEQVVYPNVFRLTLTRN